MRIITTPERYSAALRTMDRSAACREAGYDDGVLRLALSILGVERPELVSGDVEIVVDWEAE